MKEKPRNSKQPSAKPGLATGESASELVHRHLHDQTHETSDEEIRNIQLDLDVNTEFSEDEDNTETGVDEPAAGNYPEKENDNFIKPTSELEGL